MELSSILPESERANFADPEQHVIQHFSSINLFDYRHMAWVNPLRTAYQSQIGNTGRSLLDKLQQRKSKMTVKTLVTIYKRGLRDKITNTPLAFLLAQPPSSGESFDQVIDGFSFSAIKYLANDGFIKLSSAEMFENSEVLQYHATAQPKFRSGKFHL